MVGLSFFVCNMFTIFQKVVSNLENLAVFGSKFCLNGFNKFGKTLFVNKVFLGGNNFQVILSALVSSILVSSKNTD